MALTAEERRKKFATPPPPTAGLRSRGFRKLSESEQKDLFNNLIHEKDKLETLRILRENVNLTPNNKEFKQQIYESSLKRCIESQKFDALASIFAELEKLTSKFNKHYAIYLANTHQYNLALKINCESNDNELYTQSILNMDWPLFKLLTSKESDTLVRSIMMHYEPQFKIYLTKLDFAYQHPSKIKK